MLYGVSNWIYGSEDLSVTFGRLRRYAYEGVELEGEPSRYAVPAMRQLCRDFELRVLSIAGMYPARIPTRDLSSPDSATRKRAVEYLQSLCDFAAALEAPLVIVVPTLVGKTAPAGTHADEDRWLRAAEAEWKCAVEAVHSAATHAEEAGIVLAVEPINRYETYLVNNVDQAIQFVKEVDSKAVRIHLDTFHMNIEEASAARAVCEAGESLANVHVADNNRQSVGRGCFDFRSLMQALVGIGYEGALAMEPLPPVPDPYIAARLHRFAHLRDEYAEECITRLRGMEAQARQQRKAG